MKLIISVICFLSSALFAQERVKTPQQIERELQEAEAQFQQAQDMFNPWYTGPLLTPPAAMMPVGYATTQPYAFVTDNYGAFDADRKSHSLKNSLIGLKLVGGPIFQTGMTPSTDITLLANGGVNWQKRRSGSGFGDIALSMGFLINKQSLHTPQIKFNVQETFPTGLYQNLSQNGLNLGATGQGSYQTQFSLAFSKLFFWSYLHPLSVRLFFGYSIATPVQVKGFNTYGGGFGTNATVHPGNSFSTDLGIEYSITQRLVFAFDVAYLAQNSTKFRGNPGTNADGTTAALGGGYSDNLSLAPALEYNWNENVGMIAGLWFSVYGRNSLNFMAGVLSLCYVYKL